MTIRHRLTATLSSKEQANGTPAATMRTVLGEGWYVRDKDRAPKAPEGIVKGLQRAFPLPSSGAFKDLLKAIDEAEAGRPAETD